MMIGVPDFSFLEVRAHVMDDLLHQIVASNSECAKCVFNHDGICFFAYNCVTTDFSYQKDGDNK